MILAALTEAQLAGARLDAACQLIGVSARTIQRWKRHPDGRRPPVWAATSTGQRTECGRANRMCSPS